MKTTGTITKVLPVRTGMSKKGSTWAAQQFVLKTDGDGKLSQAEINAVESIYTREMGITNLKGIECFPLNQTFFEHLHYLKYLLHHHF